MEDENRGSIEKDSSFIPFVKERSIMGHLLKSENRAKDSQKKLKNNFVPTMKKINYVDD